SYGSSRFRVGDFRPRTPLRPLEFQGKPACQQGGNLSWLPARRVRGASASRRQIRVPLLCSGQPRATTSLNHETGSFPQRNREEEPVRFARGKKRSPCYLVKRPESHPLESVKSLLIHSPVCSFGSGWSPADAGAQAGQGMRDRDLVVRSVFDAASEGNAR